MNAYNQIYGYARVSTQGQSLDRQMDNLMAAGVEEFHIFKEKISGTKKDRPELNSLKRVLRSGDTVIIDSLTRLGRSTKDLLELLEWFNKMGVTVKSLKEDLDTSTPSGKLLVTVLAALAEFERDTIAERVRDGVAAARARGRVGGRPPIDKSKKDTAVLMYKAGNYSIRDICDATGISNATLYRELKKRNIDRLPET